MDRDSFEQIFPDVAKVLFHGKSVDFEDFGNLFDSVVASLKEEDPTLSQGRLNCDAMKAAITSMVISPNALYYENVVPSSVGKASLANKKAYSKAHAN